MEDTVMKPSYKCMSETIFTPQDLITRLGRKLQGNEIPCHILHQLRNQTHYEVDENDKIKTYKQCKSDDEFISHVASFCDTTEDKVREFITYYIDTLEAYSSDQDLKKVTEISEKLFKIF